MDFNISLNVNNSAVAFKFSVGLDVGTTYKTASVNLSTELYLSAYGESNYGNAWLSPVVCRGAEGTFQTIGVATLPQFYAIGSGAEYTPPDIEYGFAYTPIFSSLGTVLTSSAGDGDTSISVTISKGGEGNYGEGVAYTLPAVSVGQFGGSDYYASCIEVAYVLTATFPAMDQIVFINSYGSIVDTIVGTREAIQEILETLSLDDTISSIGSLIANVDGELSALFYNGATVSDKPGLDSSSRVWVVNMENFATNQYDDYGFISFFNSNGKSYGVAEDGIYELSGETDNGNVINSMVDFGRSDLGTSQRKRVENVYLGIGSSGKMYLKVEADTASYVYEARSSSEEIRNHRVDVGKGLSGNYFNFILMNQSGCDFDMETISFEPIPLSRKI